MKLACLASVIFRWVITDKELQQLLTEFELGVSHWFRAEFRQGDDGISAATLTQSSQLFDGDADILLIEQVTEECGIER